MLIRATYTDGAKGTGVNPKACRVYVDDVNRTKPADIGRYGLHLQLKNVPNGQHTYKLEIVDHAGNVTKVERRFTVATPAPPAPDADLRAESRTPPTYRPPRSTPRRRRRSTPTPHPRL